MKRSFAGLVTLVVLSFCSSASFAQQQPVNTLALRDIHLHDPWILADHPSQTYYLYTSLRPSAPNQRSGVIAYESKDLKTWTGPHVVFEVPDNSWADPNAGVWAPEVHAYNGHYYLFATLNNYKTSLPSPDAGPKPEGSSTKIVITYNGIGQHPRGTQVFISDSPLGPFKIIGDKPIPPSDYMTLDGTFFVENGIPYMVYAHEWTQLVDGSMEAIQMAPDLSAAVGKPEYLFKASDAPWYADRHDTQNTPQNYVTDGPEMYRTRKGALLMIWSSYRDGLYVETLAHSASGRLAGPWKQDGVLVGNDSGHGMIFKSFDGRLLLVLHHPFDGRLSKARLYSIEDTGKTIRVLADVTDQY
jgi:hypothetical protein